MVCKNSIFSYNNNRSVASNIMQTIPKTYYLPKYWHDFENLVRDVAKYKFDGTFEKYGREGQTQNGVDIFGKDSTYKSIGIQCKYKKIAKGSSKKITTDITTKIIDNEIILAENFSAGLDKFIIATTGSRDTKIQNHLNSVNESRNTSGKFLVEIWFWDNIEEIIASHSELAYIYYEEVLKSLNLYNRDYHILALLFYSLSRPAFTTRFNSENNCEHFIRAISDTQQAFVTGKLYDRDRTIIGSSFPSNKFSTLSLKQNASKIISVLQGIRDYTTLRLAEGEIIQGVYFINIPNDCKLGISNELNRMRSEIIMTYNLMSKELSAEEILTDLR